MICLAIDTSSNACSACVFDAGENKILACKSEEIGRGHAERLIDLIGETLIEAGITYQSLDRIITSTGPGSFTGARVCVSAARGFGVSLKIPVVGISNFDAMLSFAHKAQSADYLALIPAGRNQFYAQATINNEFANVGAPFICGTQVLLDSNLLNIVGLTLCGNLISNIAEQHELGMPIFETSHVAIIEEIARLGAVAELTKQRPEPLYLRKPDAKPQEHFAIERA